MQYRIGLENGDENRTVAWVLGHPGCFAYGPDPDSAMQAIPDAIRAYLRWVESRNGAPWNDPDAVEVCLDDNWDVYFINEEYERVEEGYNINAWFLDDWKPLTSDDVERGLKLLSWSRADLLATLQPLEPEVLAQTYPNERWSIGGIARHVATAEWWYLNRLGLAFPREQVPQELEIVLPKVRERLIEVLPTLVGSKQVTGIDGEFWSPRKMLRRAVWHERDHTFHIQKLLNQV